MEYLHRSAGKFQLFAADEDVNQHRGDGIQYADKNPGEDDHFNERFRTAFDVVNVHSDGLRATCGHKDPGGNAEERPIEVRDHRVNGDGVSRLYAANQRRTCQ